MRRLVLRNGKLTPCGQFKKLSTSWAENSNWRKMKNKLILGFIALVFVVAACSCILSATNKSPKYEFQQGQELSLAEKYNEGELPAGASEEKVVPMGEPFMTLDGHEIKLVAELNGGDIDVNIRFTNDPETYKFRINTATENRAEWEDFEIIPFLRGGQDGKYHFWLWIKQK